MIYGEDNPGYVNIHGNSNGGTEHEEWKGILEQLYAVMLAEMGWPE